MSNQNITRRDIFKALGILSLASVVGKINNISALHRMRSRGESAPNIIVIILDTLSAKHMSLYGYRRETTPNLSRFAERAVVYHRHYVAANFTTPSTASFLYGTYPWTHRAYHHGGLVSREQAHQNLFNLVGNSYHHLAFAQNPWADILLYQLKENLDSHYKSNSFSLMSKNFYEGGFHSDALNIFRAYDEGYFRQVPGGLFVPLMDQLILDARLRNIKRKHGGLYPRGIPGNKRYGLFFLLESVFDGVIKMLSEMPNPSLAYIHLWPPHGLYNPRSGFVGIFEDGWAPEPKPEHIFTYGTPDEEMVEFRKQYDEYIAHTDAEFGRLYDSVLSTGLLENSYLIVTSDHGELFERGVKGHSTELLYDPLIHVPLIISTPNQTERKDVHSLTSAIDILPTLTHLTGTSIPNWCEGRILPELGGKQDPERSIYVVEAKINPAQKPLSIATMAMLKGKYKLITYRGYDKPVEPYEMYDLENDPEERHNLYESRPDIAGELRDELLARLEIANKADAQP